MSCLIWRRARGTTTHIQVKKIVLADFFDIYCVAQQFYSIYPASEYRTFCPAIELSPVVHRGLSAAGQLVTLVYRGKINDLTLCDKVVFNVEKLSVHTLFSCCFDNNVCQSCSSSRNPCHVVAGCTCVVTVSPAVSFTFVYVGGRMCPSIM